MAFSGWPVEAVEFYEGLEADNSKAYWQQHKSVYEQCVKGPMDELLAELRDDFGAGRVFRPYREGAHETLKTAPKGVPKDHPRIELLRQKGIVMSGSWPVGAWLGTTDAKDRVVATLVAARPLTSWLERNVG